MGQPESPYSGPDRRRQATPALSKFSFWGGQRRGDGSRRTNWNQFVDLYSFRTWVILSVFLLLNLLDSHFTLLYLQRGGDEANPMAIALMGSGISVFVLVKALGIGFAGALFCVLKNFKNGRLGVLIAFGLYQVLLIYHLSLYFNWYPGSVLP
ncbi:MAG: hypothetical protein CMJ96_02590 [Planctomycetes bacterium]|nr:hypothetical protein [Planctomycetota bacterium]